MERCRGTLLYASAAAGVVEYVFSVWVLHYKLIRRAFRVCELDEAHDFMLSASAWRDKKTNLTIFYQFLSFSVLGIFYSHNICYMKEDSKSCKLRCCDPNVSAHLLEPPTAIYKR